MTRPTLLRRAAAAAIGVDRRPSHARASPRAPGLTLTRRAAAAAIGVRTYRLPAAAKAEEAPAHGAIAKSVGDRPQSAQLPLVTLAPVVRDAPESRRTRERAPRRGRVLIAAAAVMAVAFGAYVYHEETSTEVHQPGRVSAPPASPPVPATPTGALPEKYLGTWRGVLKNDEGSHPRTLVIAQGDVGDEVVALTAVGPMNDGKEYRCTFLAELKSVSAGTVRLNSSTVILGQPSSACEADGPTTLTLVGEDRLRRANADGSGALTYIRSR